MNTAIRRFRIWLLAALCLPGVAMAGTLADSPLSLKGSVPPNVMFSLSVEFPTALVAAYQGTNDYSSGIVYKGYFDPDKCYEYNSADLTNTASNTGYFEPVEMASNRQCGEWGQWSGNVLNWATMSGLDEFRYAMTGGHRAIDTASNTVLERSFQNSQGNYFPNKTVNSFNATGMFGALTLTNYNQGVRMKVDFSGSDTVNCSNPTYGGSFNCSMALATSGSTGSCTTWTGSGTSGSPFRCTAFGAWSGAETFTTYTTGTTATFSTAPSSTTVTCTGPTLTAGNFSCTALTKTDGSTGTCTTWTGNGNDAANAYRCSVWGTFTDNQPFVQSGQAAAATFTPTVTTTANRTDSSISGCTVATAPRRIICPINDFGTISPQPTATCTVTSGSGANTSSGVYRCGSGTVWSFQNVPAGETWGFVSWTESSTRTNMGSTTYYRLPSAITYSVTTTSTPTKYYIPSYTGSETSSYTYYSTYNASSAGTSYYNVRVKVCDPSIGLESNCKSYYDSSTGVTSYKPTGVVQDNGDLMRFGVMSYFMRNDIDNAVLRSKLKYVAPQKYSPAGGTIANDLKEWGDSGVLVTHPDATDSATHTNYVGTAVRSGVINYINQFGLYPDPANTNYRYKGYDDFGKLYYETLNYLRGRSPTQVFYQGARAANADGFPVITTWDDPLLYSCQRNYIITLGDQFTHCDKRLPGSTLTNSSGQCNAYTDANGNAHLADSGSSGLPADAQLNVRTETNWVGNTEGMGATLGDSATGAGSAASYFLAGMAAWAARNDIRPDDSTKPNTLTKQTVKTFIINVEENKACGYRSQFWLAAKYGDPAGYDSNGNWLTTSNPWLSTMALSANECSSTMPPPDDADNSDGKTYTRTGGGTVDWPRNLLRASNPDRMIDSVRSAIEAIKQQIGDESALAQSSGSLNTGTGAYIYRATYNSKGWTGTVDAYTIDSTGVVSNSPAWTAKDWLPAHGNRNIFTFNDGREADGDVETGTYSRKGVPFTSAGFDDLSGRQKDLLERNDVGSNDGNGAARVEYLRGNTANEYPNGLDWRTREALLGDNINSNPLYVAAPASLQPGKGFSSFAAYWKDRKPMLYVGANDGMLHAYDARFTIDSTTGMPTVVNGDPPVSASGACTKASTTKTAGCASGSEVFAYVPSPVYDNLSKLMSPGYSHKYYVDGTPVAADVYFHAYSTDFGVPNDCDNDNPADSKLCWKTILTGGLNAGGKGIYALDITDPTAMGAGKVLWEFTSFDDANLGYTFGKPLVRKINYAVSGVKKDRWAVIFGNGFNSTAGTAHVYVALVDGPGLGNAWSQGTNYWKISLPAPQGGESGANANGIGSLTGVDANLDGTVDYVYGGDRFGNIWKLDLSSTDPANWDSAYKTGATPVPLFSATDGATPTESRQQITSSVDLQSHPSGGYMVLFGTGSWIDVTDPLPPFKTNTLYGIWDSGTAISGGRTKLQKQAVVATVTSAGVSCTAGTAGCYTVTSTCEPYYEDPNIAAASRATATNVSGTCPDTIDSPAYVAPTYTTFNQQYGWYFDLPGSGERIFSDKPKTSGSVTTYTTLQPSTDPCTGNTTGVEYSLGYLNGGAPGDPVYIMTGNTSGRITVTINGQSVSIAPSGATITGGAADTGITFNATPPATGSAEQLAAAAICGSSSGFPATSCTGAACGGAFIPGWGFAWDRQAGTSGAKRCVVDCKPAQIGTALNCNWKINPEQAGRFSWRQIVR